MFNVTPAFKTMWENIKSVTTQITMLCNATVGFHLQEKKFLKPLTSNDEPSSSETSCRHCLLREVAKIILILRLSKRKGITVLLLSSIQVGVPCLKADCTLFMFNHSSTPSSHLFMHFAPSVILAVGREFVLASQHEVSG